MSGFLMWLWLSAVVVLFGAELKAEMADTVGASKTGSLLPPGLASRLRH
ncbi:MAG: hypothetical protein ABW042_06770 [Phenylobacterium sp.]